MILKTETKLTTLIKEKYALLRHYDPSDMTLPNAVCSTCSRSLYKCEVNTDLSAPIIKACAHSGNSDSAMHTRGCTSASACAICITAGQQYRKSSSEPCKCPICTQANSLPPPINNSVEPNKPGPQFTSANLLDIQAQQNVSNKQIINVVTYL